MATWNDIEENLLRAASGIEAIGKRMSAKTPATITKGKRQAPFLVVDNSDLPAGRNIDRCIDVNKLNGYEIELPCSNCADRICM